MTISAAETGSKVALYIPALSGGGAERVMLNLAGEFAERGYRVDLVVNWHKGAYRDHIPPGVNVVELNRSEMWGQKLLARLSVAHTFPGDLAFILRSVVFTRKPLQTLKSLPALTNYLRQARPDVLISALFYANLLAIWAKRLAGADTRLIITAHNNISQKIQSDKTGKKDGRNWKDITDLMARFYSYADAIVAVSDGVADDLATITSLDRQRIRTIYNPVVTDGLKQQAAETVDHPWFASNQPPVLLAVGRLHEQKDFTTLLMAFAQVRQARSARLVILGDGSSRARLQTLARTLGVENDVDLPGWTDNPYAFMARASVFVLSSRWEGLGNVLIEALACGCPVVATDCPSGPREILDDGLYGRLVPVGDAAHLAEAITATLDNPLDPARLQARAEEFTLDRSVNAYQELVEQLLTDRVPASLTQETTNAA